MDGPEQFADEDDSYVLSNDDRVIIEASKELLWKAARCELVTAKQLEAIARVLQVFDALPMVVGNCDICLQVSSPVRMFGSHEIQHFWKIEVEHGDLSVTSEGYFRRPSTGGDSFTSMRWRAQPGLAAEYGDYLKTIELVDDAQPFNLEVQHIDFSQVGYSLTVCESVENFEEASEDEEGCESSRPMFPIG